MIRCTAMGAITYFKIRHTKDLTPYLILFLIINYRNFNSFQYFIVQLHIYCTLLNMIPIKINSPL